MTNLGDMNIEMRVLDEDPALAEQAKALAAEAARVDGVAPISEQFLLGLQDPRLGHRHLVALVDGVVAGYAAIEEATAELVVSPDHRRRGIGESLYRELSRQIPGVQVWAHGNTPAAQGLAKKMDLERVRELLVMGVVEPALAAAAAYRLPAGFVVEDLAQSRAGRGAELVDQAWLEANNDAFSWHPEQGGWDRAKLSRAQEVDWFRAEDVLFLWDERGAEPVLAGFHWTKWHTGEEPALGEVYVVGLAAGHRGQGLGGTILSIGLAHLLRRGVGRVILYVEADNAAAVKVYQNSGFDIVEQHIVFA
ncbi:Mycothiol acetyltransferase [Corynebacterium occultum]|uniref:Mycothiol acetyltransferase n=1 Tax=Corynebacterium occultum TaxID=2675219 RepID=A0A6B8W3T1_9CORY|nr:mycothiol synthase [Corynebacterium occultum]QGU08204.1 Mycothiol acetyltransferase [Corynebacterium occultum]